LSRQEVKSEKGKGHRGKEDEEPPTRKMNWTSIRGKKERNEID